MQREPHQRSAAQNVAVVVALTAVAAALRLYRLGQWPLEGDEIFTLRDSLQLRFDNPRPLLYALNHYLVLPFRPLDELGLRILPVIFGILAVPAMYVVVRQLAGARPAIFSASLLTVSNLHIYHSQYARYWSLVFLLATIYPYAIYLGVQRTDRRLLALGLITGGLAALAHPVSVLLAGGLVLWLVVTHLRSNPVKQPPKERNGRWGIILIFGVVMAILWRFTPILHEWIAAHDAPRPLEGRSEHLLHLPGGTGITQIALLLSYAEGLTFTLVLTGAVGGYLLWRERDRSLSILLLCLFSAPVVFLTLLSLRTAVSTSYLYATAPVFFIGAGVFLDWIADLGRQLRPHWVLPATVTVLVIIPGMPTLVSQYLDGRRYDFRAAAEWLEPRLHAGDRIFSDQYQILHHYIPGREVERLNVNLPFLTESIRKSDAPEQALWIVIPFASHSFRTNPGLGGLLSWIYQHCDLRNTIGTARIDFRQNFLQIYRCTPATNDEVRTHSE